MDYTPARNQAYLDQPTVTRSVFRNLLLSKETTRHLHARLSTSVELEEISQNLLEFMVKSCNAKAGLL